MKLSHNKIIKINVSSFICTFNYLFSNMQQITLRIYYFKFYNIIYFKILIFISIIIANEAELNICVDNYNL